MEYTKKTEKELKEIALGVKEGKIFTSFSIKDDNLIGNIFMPLLFINEEVRKDLISLPVGMIYENMSEASPTAINGYPTFCSCKILNDKDTKKLLVYVDKLVAMEKEFMS